jgi:hypothetical protein
VPEGKIVPGTVLIQCIKKQFINDGFRSDLERRAPNHNILRPPQYTTAPPSCFRKNHYPPHSVAFAVYGDSGDCPSIYQKAPQLKYQLKYQHINKMAATSYNPAYFLRSKFCPINKTGAPLFNFQSFLCLSSCYSCKAPAIGGERMRHEASGKLCLKGEK